MGDKIESWFTLPGRLALVILSEFRDKLDQDHKDVFVKAMSIGCYVSTLFIFLLKSSKTMEFLATYTYLSVFNTVTKAPIVHTKNWVTATGDLIVLLIMSVIIFISACMIMAMFVSYIAKLLIGGLTKVFKKDSERYTALIFLLIMLYIAIPVLMNIHWGSVGKITHNSSTPSSSINSGYILAICGLVLDVGGGILLARSVLRQKPSELSTQSGAYLGSNPHTVKNGIGASIEAKFAISLLVSGFFGQFTGTLVQGATNLQVSHKWTWIIGTILMVLSQ
ncbi:hypothetical protein NZD89_29115 (plasmid) [Alicyclobacillus fastidiosus]|uniref:Uncharacterized protein n=1 Tax=Alicyclobacillus fastidiosus TaxID=392011 RepID=A0ABY6ZS53_9BACL|nr:hypothetical protein [Alicyclobacillus fastidiosus]WAH44976.1 hypothetical protein NZD89_29115 [Alicyclobacillus fastidiosus]GMA66286.1 hypothetical protein GCM10025859_67280 [Alicyclobacillus fastidiosus]GMA66335.1 hypothetical protein GCM10025859_67770 [Alicyclobacillus fastidiosus]